MTLYRYGQPCNYNGQPYNWSRQCVNRIGDELLNGSLSRNDDLVGFWTRLIELWEAKTAFVSSGTYSTCLSLMDYSESMRTLVECELQSILGWKLTFSPRLVSGTCAESGSRTWGSTRRINQPGYFTEIVTIARCTCCGNLQLCSYSRFCVFRVQRITPCSLCCWTLMQAFGEKKFSEQFWSGKKLFEQQKEGNRIIWLGQAKVIRVSVRFLHLSLITAWNRSTANILFDFEIYLLTSKP